MMPDSIWTEALEDSHDPPGLEALIDLRTRELQQSRDLLGSVIDGIPDAVFLFEEKNGDLHFVYTNAAGASLLHRKPEEVIGKKDVDIINPAHASENRRVLETGKSALIRERLLETLDGPRCFEVRKFPLVYGSTGKTALLTIFRDISELRKLEDSLHQTQKLDALGKLTGGVAHDFNNLLAIAIGNIDLLDEIVRLEPDARELLESARNACLRGAELTSHLLAFARKQTLQPVATEVNSLVSDYAKLLVRLLGEHIDLRLDLAMGLWQAIVDRGQLETAITNLATNARDAMPRGGRLTIATRNEVLEGSYTENHPGLMPGEYVAIEVGDTGRGMTADVLAKAVEPFFTTKEEGKGTGLGLSMVFGFAKQSGGHVRIYSEIDRGTNVTLLLPRAHGARSAEEVETPSMPRARDNETVLVVEDNANLRRLAVRQLNALGCCVVEAVDGPSALKALEGNPAIDLVLTDIIMPGGLSGADLGREARRSRPDLKLLYMSGFPESAFGDEARLDPDVHLLRKPFRQAELAARIRKTLDASK